MTVTGEWWTPLAKTAPEQGWPKPTIFCITGVVLGEPVTDWRGIDLVAAYGAMTINGQPTGEGKGGDVLGHPLEALAWLANTLAGRGKSLQKDMIVMTGSIVTTKFLNQGDEVHFGIDTLGEVRLTVG